MLVSNAELVPAGAREWLAAALWRSAVRLTLKPILSPRISIDRQRRWSRWVADINPPRRDVEIKAGRVGGIKGEWLSSRAAALRKKAATILYLHGGGYCAGSPISHRALTAQLAHATGLPVFAADYRLAPEHRCPAAVDDAVSAFRALSQQGPAVIVGDSAGGGLAVAAAQTVRGGASTPAALILFSPWVDLTLAMARRDPHQRDPMLSLEWLDACARHYLGDEDATAVLASPLLGDLHGLPPVLIQAGEDELLRSDAVRLHEALHEAGVDVCCEIVTGRWHVFQWHAGRLPSADAAIARAAAFLSRHVA